MIVKPAEGALVREPATSAPLAAGTKIDPTDPYFARALADGDLVEDHHHRQRSKDRPAHTSDEVKA